MFKKIWEEITGYMFTTYDIEVDIRLTRLFVGIILGFIITTALIVSYV